MRALIVQIKMSRRSLPSDSEMEKIKAKVRKLSPFEQAVRQPPRKRVQTTSVCVKQAIEAIAPTLRASPSSPAGRGGRTPFPAGRKGLHFFLLGFSPLLQACGLGIKKSSAGYGSQRGSWLGGGAGDGALVPG